MKAKKTNVPRIRLSEGEYNMINENRGSRTVGIIGDTHEPFCHPGYRDFCNEVFNRFACDEIVHIGDEVDNHALSYHEADPDGHSAGREAEAAQEAMNKWYKNFPDVKVCVGNHSALPFRKSMTAGLPKRFIKTYEEIWEAPEGWKWGLEWEIDNVIYTHGTGNSGKDAAAALAVVNQQSTVIGHLHSFGGTKYLANNKNLIFGLNVGCGIDNDAYAMAYGKNFKNKPTLGCGIVLDEGRMGIFIPMDLGKRVSYK